MIDLIHYLKSKKPNLENSILKAHMNISVRDFIKKSLVNSVLVSFILSFFSILVLNKISYSHSLNLTPFSIIFISFFLLFPIFSKMIFEMFLSAPQSLIKKRKKDIDREILFAGRFLLIKLSSGQPLMNALVDASKSYGVSSKYFKEIVDDINLGMALEEAIDRAMLLSPSEKFRKILFQINNALTIGVDVSETLKSVLDDITNEQLNEIDTYNHKLNTVAMIYMLVAIVGPSLGLTIFMVIAGLIGFQISTFLYVLLWIFIVFIQVIFINIFRSIRPNINF